MNSYIKQANYLAWPVIIKVAKAANCKGVCLHNTSKPHSYHLKNMAIIMTLWIGNGAVLKSSSQWQLNFQRILKINNSWTESFHFQNY